MFVQNRVLAAFSLSTFADLTRSPWWFPYSPSPSSMSSPRMFRRFAPSGARWRGALPAMIRRFLHIVRLHFLDNVAAIKKYKWIIGIHKSHLGIEILNSLILNNVSWSASEVNLQQILHIWIWIFENYPWWNSLVCCTVAQTRDFVCIYNVNSCGGSLTPPLDAMQRVKLFFDNKIKKKLSHTICLTFIIFNFQNHTLFFV